MCLIPKTHLHLYLCLFHPETLLPLSPIGEESALVCCGAHLNKAPMNRTTHVCCPTQGAMAIESIAYHGNMDACCEDTRDNTRTRLYDSSIDVSLTSISL